MSQKTDILVNEILTKKIGLTKDQATWVVKLSEKHAIWIANQVKSNPTIYPKKTAEVRKILAWNRKNPSVRIKDYDFNAALKEIKKTATMHFLSSPNSLKNTKVVAVCEGTEYKWVEINTKADCIEEGVAMKNCLKDNEGSGYLNRKTRLFSLRNKFNRPVVTIQIVTADYGELRKSKVVWKKDEHSIGQYCGKGNVAPSDEYAECFKFLEKQEKLQIPASSKISHGLPTELDMEAFQEALDDICADCQNGDITREIGDRRILNLIECAKKSKLKVNLSTDVLDGYAPPEDDASLEYDDDGSLIC